MEIYKLAARFGPPGISPMQQLFGAPHFPARREVRRITVGNDRPY